MAKIRQRSWDHLELTEEFEFAKFQVKLYNCLFLYEEKFYFSCKILFTQIPFFFPVLRTLRKLLRGSHAKQTNMTQQQKAA